MEGLFKACLEMARISAMVLFLVAGATVFSYFLALSTIPTLVSTWIVGLEVSRYVVLTIIIAIYFLLGCFLDSVSMMVLTLPVIFPVIVALHFDPIWFGVVCVLMMEAGLITPPVGLNVYTLAGIAKDVPMGEIFKGAAPFLLSIIATTHHPDVLAEDRPLSSVPHGRIALGKARLMTKDNVYAQREDGRIRCGRFRTAPGRPSGALRAEERQGGLLHRRVRSVHGAY